MKKAKQNVARQHREPKSDIDIARAATMRPIAEVAADKLGIPADALEPYGHYKAKIGLDYVRSLADKPDGKLILVTAITPTPAGEGKTTTTVGLGDALNRIGKKAMLCLREPSLGPCFGIKGGAAGGGYAQVVPMADIKPALHRRFPRRRRRPQPSLGPARQPHLLRQRRGHRRAPHRLAPGRRHERPGAAPDRVQPGRRRQRLPAPRRFRHHRRLRGHGHLLPRHRLGRFTAPPGQHHRRLHPRA